MKFFFLLFERDLERFLDVRTNGGNVSEKEKNRRSMKIEQFPNLKTNIKVGPRYVHMCLVLRGMKIIIDEFKEMVTRLSSRASIYQ